MANTENTIYTYERDGVMRLLRPLWLAYLYKINSRYGASIRDSRVKTDAALIANKPISIPLRSMNVHGFFFLLQHNSRVVANRCGSIEAND